MNTDKQASLQNKVNELINEFYNPEEPGVSVIVARNGETVLRQSLGLANLELGVAIEPDMVFRVGSITKQFTAVCILILVEQEKLGLDDSITDYVPDYPCHENEITIRHLLNHTSGIVNYTDIPEWPSIWKNDLSLEELIAFFKDQPMRFKPGLKHEYSNSGYILLGAVIEEVSGMTYDTFLQTHIFKPLKMVDSYYDRSETIIPRRVSGYDKKEDGYINTRYLSMTQPHAAGAIASTVDDLSLWEASLNEGTIVKRETLEAAFTPGNLSDGSEIHYGFGWLITDYEGFQFQEHGGGINGFLSYGIRIPEYGAYVAALSNNTSIDPGNLCLKIASEIVGKPYCDPQPIELDTSVLKDYEGVYQAEEGEAHHIALKEGKLFSSDKEEGGLELIPFSEDDFYYQINQSMRLKFKRTDQGTVTELKVYNRMGYSEIAVRG
jgi:CubicO group peptidase (beta-lactamase class C family)